MKKTILLLLLLRASVAAFAQSDGLVTSKGYLRGDYEYYPITHHFESIDGVLFEVYDEDGDRENIPNVLISVH